MRIEETGATEGGEDPVVRALLGQQGVFVGDHALEATPQLVDGNLLHLTRGAAVVDGLNKPGQVEDGTAQGLGRNGSLIQTGASQQTQPVDDDDTLPRLCRLDRTLLPGRSCADDGQIHFHLFCHSCSLVGGGPTSRRRILRVKRIYILASRSLTRRCPLEVRTTDWISGMSSPASAIRRRSRSAITCNTGS